jgi:glycosyltransferase involved in cell wall biosynthesis
MIGTKKIAVVLPAYNAAKTLVKVVEAIPRNIVDDVILVDDSSSDDTVTIAKQLGLACFVHSRNRGYGANQKTCFRHALSRGNDIIVLLHPDYQYSPELITPLAHMVASEIYDVALGSRMLGKGALIGGMPRHKFVVNKLLTLFQNAMLNQHLSEYHTGYRAFSSRFLSQVPYENNSNAFIFDNEILLQAFYLESRIGEISCPTRYDTNSSSISLLPGLIYAFQVISRTIAYRLTRLGLLKDRLYMSLG